MSFFSQNASVSSLSSSGGGCCRRVKACNATSNKFNASSKMNASSSRTSGRRYFTGGGKRIVVLAEDDGEAKRIGFNALKISTRGDKMRARAAEEEGGESPCRGREKREGKNR